MSEVFVVKNQLGHYWGKVKAWEDGTEPKAIMHFKHEDEAINTLFELSSKDIELRGEILLATLSEKGNPVVEPSEHLLPRAPKVAKGDFKTAPAEGDAQTEAETAEATEQAPQDTADDANTEATPALES